MTRTDPLRVALVGSHGTGKTTLLRSLEERARSEGVDLLALPEAPREVCRRAGDPEFFRRGRNAPLRQALLLVQHLIEESRSLADGPDVLLMDRALLDYWVYTSTLFGEQLVRDGVHDLLEALVLEHCRTYDLFLFVPVEFAPVDDGVREADPDFQQRICAGIGSRLDALDTARVEVRGDLRRRTDSAWDAIQEARLSRRSS